MPNCLWFRRKKKKAEENGPVREPEPEPPPPPPPQPPTPPPEVEQPPSPSPPPSPPAPTPPPPPPSAPSSVPPSVPPSAPPSAPQSAPPSEAPSMHKDAEACVGPLYPELICCGCNKMYASPFLLPCNDSVCETCLHQMKSEMKADKKGYFSIKCPICTLEFHFESIRDIKFPENYLLQIILQEQKRKANSATSYSPMTGMMLEESKIFCQLCDEKFPRSSITRCVTCSLNFCEKCLNEIHGNKAFLSHTLSDTVYITDTPIRCHIHPENEIIMYCSNDHVLLCEACLVEGHENHNNRPVHDAFQTETKEVLGMASNFRKVVESCERNIAKLNALKAELDETESEIDQRLFKEFLTLHKEIQLQHTLVNERIKSEKLKKKIQIDNFLDSSSQSVYRMEGLEQLITEALKQVNPSVFLQMANPIKTRIKTSMSSIVQPSNCLTDNPLKELKFDFAFIRAQINNIHLKIIQPEHIVFYAESRQQTENKDAKDGTLPRSASSFNKKDSSTPAESRHQTENKCANNETLPRHASCLNKKSSSIPTEGRHQTENKCAKDETLPRHASSINKKSSSIPAEDCHQNESKGAKDGTLPRPASGKGKKDSSIPAKSTTLEEDEDDCKEDSDAPSENANNHRFESGYTNSFDRKSPPPISECPSESSVSVVEEKDIQCVVTECEDYESNGPNAYPDHTITQVNSTNKQTFVPQKKDCQPNQAGESTCTAVSDTSVWLCCEITNEGNKEEINGYLKDDVPNERLKEAGKEIHGNKKKSPSSRLSSDHKTEKRPKSSPSLVNGNAAKPAISYHSSSKTDLVKNPSDETWVPPLLPGKPTIYEHTADSNSAKIYWGLLNEDEAVKYYEVQLQEMKTENNYQSSLRDQSGLFSGIKNEVFKAKELNANSEYMFRVRAVNTIGRGEWSDPYKVSTVNSFIIKNDRNDRRGCAAPSRGHCGRMQTPRITYYQTGD